jgi:hypothetical protein
MTKPRRNPSELEQSNPLIGLFAEDTFNNISAVLSLLQDYFGNKAGDDMPDAAQLGGYLVFDVVQDALRKQAAAVQRQEGEQ